MNPLHKVIALAVSLMIMIPIFIYSTDSKVARLPAPTVVFKPINNSTTFNTDHLKGSVTLINFWATSCTTCVKEMPTLVKVYNDYQLKGYKTIAVAMSYDTPEFVNNFVRSRELPFDVVFDEDGSIAKAFNDVKVTPTSFLINKEGQIIKRYSGEIKFDDLKNAVESAL